MRHPYRTKYLEFRHVRVDDRKTPMITVHNHQTFAWLGRIKWSGAWRQFCFFPESNNLMFNRQCLLEISEEIEHLMRERREQRATDKTRREGRT